MRIIKWAAGLLAAAALTAGALAAAGGPVGVAGMHYHGGQGGGTVAGPDMHYHG